MRLWLFIAGLCAALATAPAAAATREVNVDVARAAKPIDRFFDLSVGSDYSGTMRRDDAQGQL